MECCHHEASITGRSFTSMKKEVKDLVYEAVNPVMHLASDSTCACQLCNKNGYNGSVLTEHSDTCWVSLIMSNDNYSGKFPYSSLL